MTHRPSCPLCAAALAALRELVDLKDGPRGEDYERRKPAAWEAARRVVEAAA